MTKNEKAASAIHTAIATLKCYLKYPEDLQTLQLKLTTVRKGTLEATWDRAKVRP